MNNHLHIDIGDDGQRAATQNKGSGKEANYFVLSILLGRCRYFFWQMHGT